MNLAALRAARSGDLENFLVAATPGGIERQERAGQIALVQSTNMPIEMQPDRSAYEAAGFTFGDPVDELFLSATLPEGWARQGTDHSMWSTIVDAKGRERIAIFYKAAFYDRRAFARMAARYGRSSVYSDDGDKAAETVTDGDAVIQSFPVPPRPVDVDTSYGSPYYAAKDAVRQQADAWLAEHFPDHENPLAYWD